jgi:hypothetical protein
MIKTKKTIMKPEIQRVKLIRQVKRTITQQKIKFQLKQVQRKAIRMVKEKKVVKKQVPRNIPVPIGELSLRNLGAYESCGCFRRDCECTGQAGCGCCFPVCDCAPSMISPTEFEEVITEEDCEVPREYIETITIELPVLVPVEVVIEEPEEYYDDVSINVPHVVEIEEEIMTPVLVDKMIEIEVP